VPVVQQRWRWGVSLLAILLLNASLAFYNIWPSPKIGWSGQLSLELALVVLALAWRAHRAQGAPESALSTRGLRWLAGVWVALVLGRYLDVMAPALYGRPINLYWDSRHLRAVFEMMTNSWPAGLVLAGVTGIVVALGILYLLARWAWRVVGAALVDRAPRAALVTGACLIVLVWVVERAVAPDAQPPIVARTVSQAYLRHARLLTTQLTTPRASVVASNQLPPSDLGAVKDADVYVLFVESYGAVTYDRREVVPLVSAARARFETAVRESGRQVVSAFVESPTFAGSSWLAHVSFLTGVEARDEDTNVVLMSQQRETLIQTFARQGYRTVALMPGLSHSWPEGAFYRFDHIYDVYQMGYPGPLFSWWTVPDQFALGKIDHLEQLTATAPRQPRFIFFPTTSTHAPFGPTAPYQPDWARLVSATPYDERSVAAEMALEPDWTNMTPSYGHAMSYAYDSIGGYLTHHAGRDIVMLVIGDHQPAAAVSGEGASWDVPVHIVASRPQVLNRLLERGFRAGMSPARQPLSKLHQLLPTMLEAFSSAER
jgi:hypothetical protein